MPTRQGSIRLFQVRGITVFLHWSWLAVAGFEIMMRRGRYASLAWNIAEYVSLFGIVLLHEFGHAFACRSVGGRAEQIVLWPLGGVAYVQPPQRPGAQLWSIAAGPLVNLALIVPSAALLMLTRGAVSPDLSHYFEALVTINVVLFLFNCLPIYPLDGGQMLRSLLWFVIGRAKSLYFAAIIGLIGAVGLAAVGLYAGSVGLALIAAFAAIRSWSSVRGAKALAAMLTVPVHAEATCPSCLESPPVGRFWRCACGAGMDVFATPMCAECEREAQLPTCPRCGQASPIGLWKLAR